VIGEIEDNEDENDDSREHQPQRPRGSHLVLKLTAPGDTHSLRELDLLRDRPLRLVHKAHDVATANIERDIVQKAAIFAFDHRRTFDDANIGHG